MKYINEMVLTFEPVDTILKCDIPMEAIEQCLPSSGADYAVQGGSADEIFFDHSVLLYAAEYYV